MPNRPLNVTVDDYLAAEAAADQKSEYVAGNVYAMVGATSAHQLVVANACIAIGLALKNESFMVFMNEDKKSSKPLRIELGDETRFYYPDVMVFGGETPDDAYREHPIMVVEVLAQTTRRTDEVEKRDAYLSTESLSAYLLLETSSVAATCYWRDGETIHDEDYFGEDAIIELPQLHAKLRLGDVYQGVQV